MMLAWPKPLARLYHKTAENGYSLRFSRNLADDIRHDDIFRWSIFAARFKARRRAQAFRMQFTEAHVGQIADTAQPFRQPFQQPRLLQNRDIGGRAWHAVGHIHYLTSLLIDY